uniref:glycosyltransferase n=1 Tax=Phocaeicola sp. TaxID=2773926 RepID=UPI003FEEC51D
MKVTAVIVTFNRLVLLQKTLDYVRMTPLVTHIIVVNNGSTDGTTEWLDTQADLDVIHQDNVGASGGF